MTEWENDWELTESKLRKHLFILSSLIKTTVESDNTNRNVVN